MLLKCLAINPPYAELIMSGQKDVENRTWATSHRGLLAVYETKNGGGRGALTDSAPRIAIGLRRFRFWSRLPLFVFVDEHPDPVDVFVNGFGFGQAHCHPIFLPVTAHACQNADRRLSLVCSLFHCIRHVIPFSSCNQAY